jgi:lysophospholipase L1-like esterase
MLQSTTRLLFIGDSITDCGRRDPAITAKDPLGLGFVRNIADYLLARDPANAPVVINRGIGGNKVTDLAARWETDVLHEKPDWLSIKIGINDVWHGYTDPARGVPVAQFREVYGQLLRDTKRALPRVKLILCEPTVIGPPAPADGNERLKPYLGAIHELAHDFHATLVRLHLPFLRAQQLRPDVPWAPDGVHPHSAGNMLIARVWLQTLQLL